MRHSASAWTKGRRADVVVAVLVLVIVAAWSRANLDTLGWVLAVVESAALCLRSRHPVAVAIFILLVCLVYYPLSAVHGPIWPAFLVAVYTVAARARPSIAVVLVSLALLEFAFAGQGTGTPRLAETAPFLLAGWLIAASADRPANCTTACWSTPTAPARRREDRVRSVAARRPACPTPRSVMRPARRSAA